MTGTSSEHSRYEALMAWARTRSSIKAIPEASQQEPLNAQLPLWPNEVRAVPNGFLRSALFGAIAKGARRYIDGEQLAALDGIEIRYTGQRLDQGDLDTWESVLHAVRLQDLGGQCRVTSYGLLKLMGKTDTGKNRATLHKRITRLVASALTVKQDRYSYIGSLIAGAAKDEETQEWVIELDSKLRPLFAADQFTQVEWAVRQELHGKPLAQWLHGFYASHAKPFPMKVETLYRLCGSDAGEIWKFAQTLRKALDAVAEASAAQGESFSYEICGNLVHVAKKAQGAQLRHLAKNARKPRDPRG
ncbi:plasmid replication initiator TrfA [Hydrogenophaga sp. NFH-34]|uniref:plasmid replication initiator TrfA n=1 Tax=Hydrogenophaga sp. NFH-34 TaxID=2744446 RepID=UPI001F424BA3|nr:plasmid replication initiator TrfA [Hydrogenophaga sp. NFH-34]